MILIVKSSLYKTKKTMQKTLLITLSLLFFLNVFSQEKTTSKFSIKVGIEYRLTPIRSVEEFRFNNPNINFNLDRQLNGTSINYTLSYRVFKKFEIGFSQSFRYDHVYFKSSFADLQPNTNVTVAQSESVNSWITDYHFFLGKYFTVSNTDFFVKAGISLMNNGTNYTETQSVFIDENTYVLLGSQNDFNFIAQNISAGFVSKKFELGLGAYFVGEFPIGASHYPGGYEHKVLKNIILPYLKLSYRIK